MTASDIRSIINAGGNIILDASKYTSSDLRSIATTASSQNVSLLLKNASKHTTSDLRSIATAGKHVVTFDFAN